MKQFQQIIKNKIPTEVLEIITIIENNSFLAFIVGGAIRDILLSKTPKDWDITTNSLPNNIEKLFSCSKIGIKYGSLALKIRNYDINITTFRKESNYNDRRHPENIIFIKDVEEDLKRRDFTINSIAYSKKRHF